MTRWLLVFAVVFAASCSRGNTAAPGATSATPGPPAPAALPAPAKRSTPFAVVELFTSEGCSSCPPADENLSAIAAKARPGVYALSFHVDYWNDLGWRDPYSAAAYSERQRRYADKLDGHRVYTPQLIVNGTDQMVGSDRAASRRAIDRALEAPVTEELGIEPVSTRDGKLRVRWHASAAQGLLLSLAVVQSQGEKAVTRGENAGRTLSHANVVHAFQSRRMQERDGASEIAIGADVIRERAWLIGYLQRESDLRVVAAAAEPLDS
ncbi:MAG: DUF1223 domain-containing protein [Myxococcales bacterium]|nr:DUF1223 domain-containing protein [Myxococcales bacterium]MCB9575410.1 DUF1223 domain-containing protein [Polyangiaceae bacterium]